MAEIPVAQENVNPTVAGGGNLPMIATPANMGAGVGEAIAQGGEVANRVHRDAMMNFNQAVALDAHNQLQSFNQATLFDPQKGLLNQNTGIQAPDKVKQTLEAYDQKVSSISAGLPNDQAKMQFAHLAADNRNQIQQHLDGYESRQINTYHEQVTQATVKNAAVAAVQNTNAALADPSNNVNDPGVRQQVVTSASNDSIALGVAAIKDEAARKNQPQATTDEQLQAFQSAAHYGVIQSLNSQGKDQDAKAYYNAYKDKLIGEQADHAALQVDAGSTAGEAIRRAPALVFDDKGQVRDVGAIWDDVNADKSLTRDPKLMQATEMQVRRLLQQQDEAKRDHQEKAVNDAFDMMQSSPAGFNDPAVQAKIAGLPPEKKLWLQSADLRQQALNGKEIPDGSNEYLSALAKATNFHKQSDGTIPAEDFANGDISQYRGQMSKGDFTKLTSVWEQRRGQLSKNLDADGNDQTAGIMSSTQFIGNTLQRNGISEKLPNGQPNPDWFDFQRDVDRMAQANGGVKKMGLPKFQEEVEKMVMRKNQDSTNFLGTTATKIQGPMFFKTITDDYPFSYQQMTDRQRSEAMDNWKRKGVANPTPAQLFESFINSPSAQRKQP